jgi:hypothetical protein
MSEKYTTEVVGDQIVCTLNDGRKVSIHKDIWEHSYSRMPVSKVLVRLKTLAAIDDALRTPART